MSISCLRLRVSYALSATLTDGYHPQAGCAKSVGRNGDDGNLCNGVSGGGANLFGR